jgi:Flp pilus assembly protein TadD
MRENRIAEGLAHFESASAIHPDEPSAWLYRGRVLAQTGRSNEARLLLEQARPQVRDASAIDAALRQLNTTGNLQ